MAEKKKPRYYNMFFPKKYVKRVKSSKTGNYFWIISFGNKEAYLPLGSLREESNGKGYKASLIETFKIKGTIKSQIDINIEEFGKYWANEKIK